MSESTSIWFPNADADIVLRLRSVMKPPREWIDEAAKDIARLRADLAAVQARADGYALLVGELRAALTELLTAYDNIYVAQFGMGMAVGVKIDPNVDIASLPARAVLAADPEARAHELLSAAQKESAP